MNVNDKWISLSIVILSASKPYNIWGEIGKKVYGIKNETGNSFCVSLFIGGFGSTGKLLW